MFCIISPKILSLNVCMPVPCSRQTANDMGQILESIGIGTQNTHEFLMDGHILRRIM